MSRRVMMLACAAVCGLAMVTVSAQQATGPAVDDLITKNLDAKGGLAKIRAIQSLKQTANLMTQGMSGVMTVYQKRPNRIRQEIQIGPSTVMNGFDGVTAWIVNPMAMAGSTRPIAVTGPQADMVREQGDIDGPLVDYRNKGFTVEVLKPETIGEKAVNHLRLISATRQVVHLYLDAATNLELKRTTEVESLKLEQEFSDFRTVDGLTIPFTIRLMVNGVPQNEIRVQSVEFNLPLDDAIFRMPKG